jgi:hypothetical protein
MNQQRELRWLCAIALTSAALFLFPNFAHAQTQPDTQSLEGLWLSDGYGILIDFQGDNLILYEITTLSCMPSKKAQKIGVGSGHEIVFAGDDNTFRIFPGTSQDTRWYHRDGGVSNILLSRTRSRPEPCGQPLADTPLTNYQVFWETFAEQYPFFALRKLDWLAVDKKLRTQVTPETKSEDLFQILSDMIDPLHDAHTFITAQSIQKGFRGFRPAADRFQKGNAARITEIIETKYVRGGLRDFYNGQLQFGFLPSAQGAILSDSERNGGADVIGYLRIHSFRRFPRDREFTEQLNALEIALDDIFKNSAQLTGLVIDLRINSGGSDMFGISIASRLATQEYLAYEKVMRNDIHDPDHRTPPQPILVHVSQRPGFRGPVVLLTSADSVSAAETFTMAVLDRHPQVVRVGANTQGVFSDVLIRGLPNGWTFGLPNEVYLTKDGKAFDGTGVPPDIEVPIFPTEDLANGRDSALDEALALLAHKAN